ncbi:hypothetical protein M0802_001643 [Mischocyttarus mexicanus]|nr:hypothetical protein M0802_001643 [Mischocyttarus mexicanus]
MIMYTHTNKHPSLKDTKLDQYLNPSGFADGEKDYKGKREERTRDEDEEDEEEEEEEDEDEEMEEEERKGDVSRKPFFREPAEGDSG